MANKVTFSSPTSDFTATLRKKVDEYFASNGGKHTGNVRVYLKTAILVLTGAAAYTLLIMGITPIWLSIILCVLLGIVLAGIGFNVMHEGAHGSYSPKQWINEIMALSLNAMGGNSFLWKEKHNVNHHSYTNVEGHDEDIDIRPWFRTNVNQPKRWFHRYQYIYWALLYGFTYLIWVYSLDFKKYFTGKITKDTRMKKMKLKDHFIFWISKLTYFFIFLVIPLICLGFVKTLVGYLITSFVCGWVISVVFQLAHLVEDAAFPVPAEITKKIDHEWTIHQIVTTANFSTKSKFVSWFVGGLNFQIEHHLFPRTNHVHYPSISKLVKEVCEEYNIRYMEFPTVLSALRSHIGYLKVIGVQ
jgi:linoleoyl-CoA desaturase